MQNLSKEAVSSWALRNGFLPVGKDTYEVEAGNEITTITLKADRIRVHHETTSTVKLLADRATASLRIDQDDMLRGAGLFGNFQNKFKAQERRTPGVAALPGWFNESLRTKLEAAIKAEIREKQKLTDLASLPFG
jgi:hypothetical protein